MRIKRNYSHLPIEEQIKKLKFKLRFTVIIGIIINILIAIASILIWCFTEERKLAIGFLISVPISLFLGIYLNSTSYKEEIKKLYKEQREEEPPKSNYYR